LLPAALRNYLAEVARVLKPGGRCFITCYLLNPEAQQMVDAGLSYEKFRFAFDGCRIETAENPEHIVAYDENTMLSLYEKSGLALSAPVYHGGWCGRKNGLTHQDVIVAQKR
jgi:SAM-dependent methyltransferase